MGATTYQAYYTKSEPILNYMTNMLRITPLDSVWEPCGGDGVFVDKVLEISPTSDITVFELNPDTVNLLQCKYQQHTNINVKLTDTLLDEGVTDRKYKFDKIIGNPPYGAKCSLEKQRTLNQYYPNLYSKESYTLFLYACIECLKENGELSFIIPDTFLSLHRHESVRRYILTYTAIREIALFPSSFFPGINFGYANLCIITLKKSSDIVSNLSNKISIRTGFTNVEELPLANTGILQTVSQQEIYDRLDCAFMFDAPDWITSLINNKNSIRIADVATCVTGFYSGNDKDYLHPLHENCKNANKYSIVNSDCIRTTFLSEEEKEFGIIDKKCFVPIVKGGNRKYYKPNDWFMDWSSKAVMAYRKSKKCRFQNSLYYFQEGIAIPMIRSKQLTAALIGNRLFDQSIVGVFPKEEQLVLYLLAFFNSSICTHLINAINPSTNNSANYIKKIPFILPTEELLLKVNNIVSQILQLQKNGCSEIDAYEKQLDEIFLKLYLEYTPTQNKPMCTPIQLSLL